MTREIRPDVDPERREPKNPFDHGEGLFGQGYSRAREETLRRSDPSGDVNADPASAGEGPGAAASVKPNGEAQGSGAEAAEDPVRKPGAWKPGAGKNAVDP